MLISSKSFNGYYWAQFLGAFSDNLFKTALIALLTFRDTTLFGMSGEPLAALAGGVFILPFFLTSGSAGLLGDRMSKSALVKWVKLLEVFIMGASAVCFLLGWDGVLLALLFLMGAQSALFGPVKYAIIPDIVSPNQILGANTLVEMGTFLSILFGTLLGGYLSQSHIPEYVLALALFVPSLAGYGFSLRIQKLPPPTSAQIKKLHPLDWAKANFSVLRLAWGTQGASQVLLRISWFWFLGAGLIVLLPGMTKNVLHAEESVFTYMLALFCGGIAVGAVFTYAMAKRCGLRKPMIVGALGMSCSLLLMAVSIHRFSQVPFVPFQFVDLLKLQWSRELLMSLFATAFFASFFVVPLYTLLVGKTDRSIRSQLIGANNVLNSLFMVLSSGLIILVFGLGWGTGHLVAVYALTQLLSLLGLRKMTRAFQAE
jgi:MFS family permease